MQIKFLKVLLEGHDHINRIAGLSWSSNGQKLAVATADRYILLFDEFGERRDKFSTKPSNPANGKNSYVIRGLDFSPESTKLAIGQTDNIVYVYKLGDSWGDKKVICNKFPQPSIVTALIWLRSGFIIAGLDDGKVRLLNCKTNKSQDLYNSEEITVSFAQNSKGNGFLSGHDDGTIVRYFLTDEDEENEQSGKLLQHPVSPSALAWLYDGVIAIGGCDRKIIFYDSNGKQIRNFDYSRNDVDRDFTVASACPNGQTVAFGNYHKIMLFTWNRRSKSWEESCTKEIQNLFSVSALAWRRDGVRLAVGSVTGAVLIFESILRRMIWRDKFEITYVTPSQFVIKSLQDSDEKMIVESKFGMEIDDIQIMEKGDHLLARTEESLIVCDLTRNLQSEIPWIATGKHEKFYFDNPNVCFVFNVGELSLIEYGQNIILGTVRTEFFNPHVISVRLNERGNTTNNKKLAFLLDVKTICIVDLITQQVISQIDHDSEIDWLELSETAHKLLFRDKKMRLIIADVHMGKKQTLLTNVSFVQWVIQSDVAVAQSGSNLMVWYNVDFPEHVSIIEIRGDAYDVTREDGKTIVRTQEGPIEHTYQLDEGLVEFGTAINDGDFARAVQFLENLGDKPSAKPMWYNLALIALDQQNLRVAERCYIALGNVSRAFYLREMIKIADEYEIKNGSNKLCPEVAARLALLNSDVKTAERIYLEQGDINSAINMYKKLRMWDELIDLATKRNYPELESLREEQINYLLTTEQEDKAGKVLEIQGDVEKAMNLYIKAKKPIKAARLALKTPHLFNNDNLMTQITEELVRKEHFELAGDIASKQQNYVGALNFYRKGGIYARALELARQVTPDEVTSLEEEWGDWLVSKKQLDASISHYIEAGATEKALEAAVGAKQWKKAFQIAKVVDEPEIIQKYAVNLSKHLATSGDLIGAQDLLVRANLYNEAIELLNKHGQWEKAYQIAEKYLNAETIKDVFINLAEDLEKQGKIKDAEKVLITINEPDLAITMYKRLEMYDSMIRLVEKYHSDLVENTHIHLARQLETKGKLKNAETHFIAAGDWKSAVHMYCSAGRWEDGYRIAKQKGTEGASNQVAYMWAKTLPVEGAARLLTKLSLIEVALDFACDSGQFEFAMDVCRLTGKPTDKIHLKIAMSLEDEGKFEEAEQQFILANKPKEAILMHTHNGNWKAALNVAETHLPEAINDILLEQAASALESKNYEEYEALLLRAQRPDLIIQHYKEQGMLSDAIRIAEEHIPSAIPELQRFQDRRFSTASSSTMMTGSKSFIQQASEFARNEEFRKAAEVLLLADHTNSDEMTVKRSIIRAAEICNQFLEGKDAIEVAQQIGPRLIEIDEVGLAAQLYLAAEMPKEAVNVFIHAEQWGKARRLAKEINSELLEYVEHQQKFRLKNEGNVEELADIDLGSALDMLAEQGQWERCLDKAKQINTKVLHKYVALYAAQLIREGNIVTVLSLYLTYGAPAIQQNFNIYNRIALDCFALKESTGSEIWKNLRDFLYQLIQTLKGSEFVNETALIERFENFLLIAHYYTTRAVCRKIQALQATAVKISVALLRYTDIIPVDKGFLEAGLDLRSVGRESEAFVILNHYLDVCEAIEESSANLVDHSDLTATDFPSSVPIPEEMHLKDEINLHEEIREWVLAVSIDQKIDQVLPIDNRSLFESSLSPNDLACIVSAYPVMGKQPVTFQRSNKQANRDAWSKLTVAAKMSPNSDVPEIIEFIEKWCGSANFIVH